MRTLPNRNLASLLAAAGAFLAVVLPQACSYDELKGPVKIVVHNIPSSADHLEVTLTDSAQNPVTRNPALGPGAVADLELTFPAPANNGVCTLTVAAKDHDNLLAQLKSPGSINATFDSTKSDVNNPLVIEVALVSTGSVGSFGAACDTASACGQNLVCRSYNGSDVGICTKSCTGSGQGSCDSSPAGATCQPFLGGAAVCQWECDQTDGGAAACPAGLRCGSPISGKRFCGP